MIKKRSNSLTILAANDTVNYPISKPSSISIVKKKYICNIDHRAYISVFEYQLSNQGWVIWDYHTGYVFFTGLWKCCGNSKADLPKMFERFPSLLGEIKRIRGGYLKIQGTWLPFNLARKLAINFAYFIRFDLVPVFGADFPSQCLKPDHVHFGKLIDLDHPVAPLGIRKQSRPRKGSYSMAKHHGSPQAMIPKSYTHQAPPGAAGTSPTRATADLDGISSILRAAEHLNYFEKFESFQFSSGIKKKMDIAELLS